MDQGQQVRYQFPVPEEGLTVRLCVRNGLIVLYASTTIPNPNQAYYDWKLECIDCDDCEMFVDPEDFEVIPADVEVPQRRRRQAMVNTTEEVVYTNFTVYISVEGMEDRNTFELNTDVGDTTGINILMWACKVICDSYMCMESNVMLCSYVTSLAWSQLSYK